mgnify:CR=1 FL=1
MDAKEVNQLEGIEPSRGSYPCPTHTQSMLCVEGIEPSLVAISVGSPAKALPVSIAGTGRAALYVRRSS